MERTMTLRAASSAAAALAATVAFLLSACDSRPTYRRTPRAPGAPTAPASPGTGGAYPSPGGPAQPVSFAAQGFLTNSDLSSFGLEPDPRLNGKDVVNERYGEGHRYLIQGEFEVQVMPMSDSGSAAQKSEEQRKGEINKGNTGISLGRVLEFDVQPSQVAGTSCWSAWIVRAEGRLVYKVGFAKGPFYVSVLVDSGGGKSDVEPSREKAERAARYVAGKLR